MADLSWTERPMRWAQLTLTEDDPDDFDLEFWLNYFRSTHAQGACLSVGGYVAYYPTEIPLHHRSSWLGKGDPFGDLVQGCREMGMSVLARTDPHAIHPEAAQAHPEWIAVTKEGRPRRHWSMPEAWVTCALGPYNFEFMTQVHREIVTRYPVDGIFSNRWSGHGLCYCEHCRQGFYTFSGLELPQDQALDNPAWRAYRVWRQERLFELIGVWDAAIRQVRPAARYVPNSGGGALSDLDMVRLSGLTPLLFADRQARQGILPAWANGKNAKEFRAAYGHKPVGGIFSVGLEEKYRWKDSVQSEAELRVWMAGAIANGMRPWFTKFCGKVFDNRWLEPVREVYEWHWRNEKYLRNTNPLARVGLVYSQQTAAWYSGERAAQSVEEPSLGAYQALIESRIPFEMVHDRLLDEANLSGLKALLLPNIACISDRQCEQLWAFVQGGGGLVATWETSLFDEQGARRSNFGLADLFGVDLAGPVEGPLKNAYLNLEHSSPESGTLLKGLETARRVIHGPYRVPVRLRAGEIIPPLTLVPAYPDLPMEEVYPRQRKTDIPGLVARQFGKGRVVYFPWDIARTFWEVLNPDLGMLIANAVKWALNEPAVIEVDGPGVLDVTVWQQDTSLTVHLVNLTNPMLMRGAFREAYPVGPLRVRLRLPPGCKPGAAYLLKAGLEAPYTEEEGCLAWVVPNVSDHEVIALELV
jgi:hypothetical protein